MCQKYCEHLRRHSRGMQRDSSSNRAVENRMAARCRRANHSRSHTVLLYVTYFLAKKKYPDNLWSKIVPPYCQYYLPTHFRLSFRFIPVGLSFVKLLKSVKWCRPLTNDLCPTWRKAQETFSWSDSQSGDHWSWRICWSSMTNELQTKWLRL